MIYRTSIGLDVHARSISAAAFVPETGEVEERPFGYDAEAVARWAGGLPQPARAVYEGNVQFLAHFDSGIASRQGRGARPAPV